jgi:outer membrane protein
MNMGHFIRVFGCFLLTALVSSSFASDAPPPLSLSRAVEEALAQSPEVLGTQADRDAASWKKLEMLAAHLPHLSANAEHFFSAKYSNLNVLFGGSKVVFPSAFPQTTLTLDASLLIFDGFSSVNRYRAAVLETEAAELRLARARFVVGAEVRVKYYQALASQTLLGVAGQNIKSLQEHLELAQAMDRSGYSTRFDVLRVQAQLEEAQAERLLAIDNAALARRALARVMGTTDDRRTLVGTLPEPVGSDVSPDLTLETAERTDLAAAQRHEAAVNRITSAESRFWVPTLSLFAQKMFYKYGDFDPAILPNATYQDSYAVGVRLKWNIFDGGASFARSEEARASDVKNAQLTRAAFLNAPEDFENWKRKFIYNSALYEARKKTVAKSEESVRLAKIGLKAGVRTSTEWLDAELELFRARAGLVRAQADADEARVELELALGHRLPSATE